MGMRDRTLHALTRSDFVRSAYGALRKIPGAGSGIQKLVRTAWPLGKRSWIRIPQGMGKGLWMNIDARFDLGYVNGDYEPWIQTLLTRELGVGDCFYELGAHTGFFAMIASRAVGPTGKVVAFEPDPDNVATLQANAARNGMNQITVVQGAVWSCSGLVTFERAAAVSSRTQGHISTRTSSSRGAITVPSFRLDEMVFEKGYPAPSLMKMDIEGAEWGALQGARRLLAGAKPKVFCEVHEPEDMGKIQDYFEQVGYAVEEWNPVHEHYQDYHRLYLWAVPCPQAGNK